jgi:hypothetical protein
LRTGFCVYFVFTIIISLTNGYHIWYFLREKYWQVYIKIWQLWRLDLFSIWYVRWNFILFGFPIFRFWVPGEGYFEYLVKVILSTWWRLFWVPGEGYFEYLVKVILSTWWRLFWVPDEGYSKNESCSLNLISTFLFKFFMFTYFFIYRWMTHDQNIIQNAMQRWI